MLDAWKPSEYISGWLLGLLDYTGQLSYGILPSINIPFIFFDGKNNRSVDCIILGCKLQGYIYNSEEMVDYMCAVIKLILLSLSCYH